MAARSLFQGTGGGSIPTSALWFRKISRERFQSLNREWHRTQPEIGPINTMRICFGAWHDGMCFAVAAWSNPVARELPQTRWAELRRFAIAPDRPSNTGSRMLGWMTREMFRRFGELEKLISYQDEDEHTGTIYKAAGWTAVELPTSGGEWANRPACQRTARRRRNKTRWEKVRE